MCFTLVITSFNPHNCSPEIDIIPTLTNVDIVSQRLFFFFFDMISQLIRDGSEFRT